MAVSWSSDTCTLTSGAPAVVTTNDICTDAGAPAGTGSLIVRDDIEIYEMREARVIINAGATWEEKTALGSDVCVWLFHSYSGDNPAIDFASTTSIMDWGNKIGTSILSPVTAKGHGYWFQTYNFSSSFHWSTFGTTLPAGIFRFYGGMFQQIQTLAYDTGNASGGTPTIPFSITGDTSGATATVGAITVDTGTWAGANAVGNMSINRTTGVFTSTETVSIDGGVDDFDIADEIPRTPILFMPTTEVEIIQTNFSRCGGIKFGPDSTVLESKFKSSYDVAGGFSFNDDNTVQIMNKIQIHKFQTALTLNGNGNAIISNLSLRGVTNDLSVTTFTGSLELVDSTNLTTLQGTLDFDGSAATNFVRQSNSYNLKTIDSAGADLNNIRVQAYRKDTNELYGADQLTAGAGVITEVITSRSQLDADHLTIGAILNFGNVGVRMRDYGRRWQDVTIIPTEKGISQVITMLDNPFTIDGTGGQFDSDTADAFTGVAFVQAITDVVSLTYVEGGASADTITRGSGSFVTDNWEAGMYLRVTGTVNNDDVYQIDTVVALTITLIATDDLVGETIVSRIYGYQVDITSGTADTLNKVYSNIQAELEKTANMDLPTFLTTDSGVGYNLADVTQITGMDNINFEGGFIVQQDGTKRWVPVIINNIISGARCAVIDQVTREVLGIVTSSDTSATVIAEYSGTDDPVIVEARLKGNVPSASAVTLLGGGITVGANFPTDTVFTP